MRIHSLEGIPIPPDEAWAEVARRQLYSTNSFALRLGVRRKWLQTAAEQRRGPTVYFGAKYWFSNSDVKRWRAIARADGLFPKGDYPTDGYVYFVRAENGLVKIGWAVDPADRLARLSRISPIPLTLLAAVRGTKADERELHLRFKRFRQHGEWFTPDDSLLAHVSGLEMAPSEDDAQSAA